MTSHGNEAQFVDMFLKPYYGQKFWVRGFVISPNNNGLVNMSVLMGQKSLESDVERRRRSQKERALTRGLRLILRPLECLCKPHLPIVVSLFLNLLLLKSSHSTIGFLFFSRVFLLCVGTETLVLSR